MVCFILPIGLRVRLRCLFAVMWEKHFVSELLASIFMGLYLCQIETFTFSILLIVFWISWQFSSISRWFYLPMPALHDFICAVTTTIKPFLLCGVGIRRHCGWLVDFSFFKSWRLLPWPSHFSQVSSPCVLLNLPLFYSFSYGLCSYLKTL